MRRIIIVLLLLILLGILLALAWDADKILLKIFVLAMAILSIFT